MREVSQFPPNPDGFMRGNKAWGQQAGFYLSLWKFVPVIGLFFGWVWLGHWVNQDACSLKVNSEFWNTAFFGGGVASLLVGVTMSPFFLGLLTSLALQGLPLGLYIRERNACVPDSARLLTQKHIKSVVFRTLARLGLHIGGKKMKQQLLGPDIDFIGKTSTGRRDTSRGSQVENSRGFLAAKELVYDAIIKRATDIHLEPKEDELQVRLRVDGVMYAVEPFDRSLGDNVINIFKILGAMDITEKRKSLDGSFRAATDGRGDALAEFQRNGGRGLQLLRRSSRSGKVVRELHAVTRSVSGGDQLFRARATVGRFRARRPSNAEGAKCPTRDFGDGARAVEEPSGPGDVRRAVDSHGDLVSSGSSAPGSALCPKLTHC